MNARAGVALILFAAAFGGTGRLLAESKPALRAAVGAADAVAALGEADLRCMVRDANRDFLVVQVEDGSTLRESHDKVRQEARVLVPVVPNLSPKDVRIARLTHELWRLGDAACDMALGYDPVDYRFLDQANDLIDRIGAVRAELRRLLPRDIPLFESVEVAGEDESASVSDYNPFDLADAPIQSSRR
jgi:hypothetical protein